MTGREDVERVVAEALAEHGETWSVCECGLGPHSVFTGCDCGAGVPESGYERHVTQGITTRIAPLIEQARREGAVEALREAAHEMKWHGIWAPDDGYIDSYEPSHADWLRDRAERVAQTGQEATSVALRGLGATNGLEVDSRGSGSERGSGGRDV